MRIAVITDPIRSRITQFDPHSRRRNELTRKAVSKALLDLGHSVHTIEVGPNILYEIEAVHPDVMFNIANGYNSKKQQANVAAMLELTDIPFTGSEARTHVFALYKDITKILLQHRHVPTPEFIVVHSPEELDSFPSEGRLPGPVIVKPSAEGSSVGIHANSVAHRFEEVRRLVFNLIETVGPPIMIERFIPGREFTVALVGYPEPTVLPIKEILLDEEVLYTYEVKTADKVLSVCPAEISSELTQEIQDLALESFVAIGCRDIARVDFRVSEDCVPYVLEINTLPGLTPGYSEVPRIAERAGIGYTELIRLILEGALKRFKKHAAKHFHSATQA